MADSLKLQDLLGKTREEQFEIAAQYAGVEAKVFDGIWATESQRGHPNWMRSAKGAEGHFGILRSTRQVWERRTGVTLNPHEFTPGLLMAALTLKENMDRFGNVEDALRAYNGGWDPSKWNNEETSAYVGKVLGVTPQAARRSSVPSAPVSRPLPSYEEIAGVSPEQLRENIRKRDEELRAERSARLTDIQRRANTVAGLTGGLGVTGSPNPDRNALDTRVSTVAGIQEVAAVAATEERRERAGGVGSQFADAFMAETWAGVMIRSMTERSNQQYDPTWVRNYNPDQLETDDLSDQERAYLRRSVNMNDYVERRGVINETRRLRENYTINGAGSGIGLSIAANMLDPVGWVAALGTAGLGKGVQIAGSVGRAAVTASAVQKSAQLGWGARTGLAALEGAAGNLAATAAMDGQMEVYTLGDYAIAAGMGTIMGAGLEAGASGLRLWTNRRVQEVGNQIAQAGVAYKADLEIRARTELGEGATAEQVAAKMVDLERADVVDTVNLSLGEIAAENQFLPLAEGEWITKTDTALRDDVRSRYGIDLMADDLEADVATEIIAKAERFVAANPVTKESHTILEKGDMASTGLTLLNSDNPVAKMVAQVLLESTTGAGGRRTTAAMSMAIRERTYARFIPEYDRAFQAHVAETGSGPIKGALDPSVRRDFDRRVFLVQNAREHGHAISETSSHVLDAADALTKGFDLMRREQQHVGTVGASRLGDSSVGYMPRILSSRAVAALTVEQERAVVKILEDQLADLPGWDRKFANELARKYLERGRREAKGNYGVDIQLHNERASDMLVDTLKAMGKTELEARELMGRFSRGGSGHTKKRLTLDMNADIGGGKKLIDLMDTDVLGVYRSYARRVAGEVALAQYGVPGRNGLKAIRSAIERSSGSGKDVNKALRAFDQIAAEFLNTPFGDSIKHGSKHMDNLRILTSLARLGGMGFTQFADQGNAIGAVGVGGAMKGVAGLPRAMREVRAIAKGKPVKNSWLSDIETHMGYEIGMDDYYMTRIFDTRDNSLELYGRDHLNLLDKGLRAGANLQQRLSLQRSLVAAQNRLMSEQIIAKAWKYARVKGKPDKALLDMGINERLVGLMRKDIQSGAVKFKGGSLANWDISASALNRTDMEELVQAIERGASQIIQRTYIGETGKWAHNDLLKILFQFRTFSLTAVEKQWGRNVRNYGALHAAGILMGTMAFAAPVHMARVALKASVMPEEEREEFLEKNLHPLAIGRATLNYAAASGLLGDVMDVGAGFAAAAGGDYVEDYTDLIGARGGNTSQLLGGVMAPSLGLIQQTWEGVNGNPDRLVRALPFSNLPYLLPVVSAMEAGAESLDDAYDEAMTKEDLSL